MCLAPIWPHSDYNYKVVGEARLEFAEMVEEKAAVAMMEVEQSELNRVSEAFGYTLISSSRWAQRSHSPPLHHVNRLPPHLAPTGSLVAMLRRTLQLC